MKEEPRKSIMRCSLEQREEKPPRPPRDFQITPMMLINDISKIMHNRIKAESIDSNLVQKSYRSLLFHLSMQDGRTQLELVKVTHLKPPTVSVTLQKMEHDGIVIRKPDESDLRATRVFLTDAGRELDRRLFEHIKTEERIIMESITEEETQTLLKILMKIRDHITDGDDNNEQPKD